MKNKLKFLGLTLAITVLSACEKVVDIDLPNSETSLVVEGGIFHNVDGSPSRQQIKLSTTRQFFDNGEIPQVIDAIVSVKDGQTETQFTHEGSGVYAIDDYSTVPGRTYTLTIVHESDTYQASEVLIDGVPIDNIYAEFDEGDSFFDDAEPGYAVKLDLTDPANIENNYLWKFYVNGEQIIEPDPSNKFSAISKDEFFDGQELTGLRAHEEHLTQVGDTAVAKQFSINQNLYEYYFAFFTLTGGGGFLGDPPPAGLKGNVQNLTNSGKNALGYFEVASVSIKGIRIQ